MTDNLVGEFLQDRYRIDAIVAQGKFGPVYRAWDRQTGNNLLLEMLPSTLSANKIILGYIEKALEKFKVIRHSNIVPCGGVERDRKFTFISRSAVEGVEFQKLFRERGMQTIPISEMTVWLKSMCEALDYLHGMGLVVGSLKHENILVDTEGRILLSRVGEFGLCEWLGTRMDAAYLAPEYLAGERLTKSVDIFELGVMLYEMVTGRHPFGFVNEQLIDLKQDVERQKVLSIYENRIPFDPSQYNRSVSPEFSNVILKAIDQDPSARYESAGQLFEDVCKALDITPLQIPSMIEMDSLDSDSKTTPATVQSPPAAKEPQKLPASDSRNSLNAVATIPVLPELHEQKVKEQGYPSPVMTPGYPFQAMPHGKQRESHPPMMAQGRESTKPDQEFSHTKPKKPFPLWALAMGVTMIVFAGLIIVVVAGLFLARTKLPFMTLFPGSTAAAEGGESTGIEVFTPETTGQPTSAIELFIPTQSPVPPTAVPTPTPIPVAIGGGSERMAYASLVGGLPQIFISNVSGATPMQLTNMSGGACQPDWSPDGTQIVFISPCAKPNHYYGYSAAVLYTMGIEIGSNPVLLPIEPAGGDFDPAWSPDGRWIAFTSLGRVVEDKLPHIMLFNLGTNELKLLYTDTSASSPSWSPDGSRIVVEAHKHIGIFYVDESEKFSVFSNSELVSFAPAWSPDGLTIYYGQQTTPMLVSKSLEEQGQIEKVVREAVNKRPAWDVDVSPDGQWILFGYKDQEIYLLRVLGGASHDIQMVGTGFHAAWAP